MFEGVYGEYYAQAETERFLTGLSEPRIMLRAELQTLASDNRRGTCAQSADGLLPTWVSGIAVVSGARALARRLSTALAALGVRLAA